ncbi:ribosomal protein S18-alanine N-acetyltransferase [Shewanella gelidii]|uniref:[Ribosomal protein bS18]-alanine N-acetyltransferase n=1 Tax=Shewanella gelidii TaxID=1642821 RepID=A0A917JLT6_9GAMM|nr:ribosomal protein S18-alanine N-acetyltransferase [Shewanella gelidii]MCL1097048.1 ribosomal protein S18-alanine N-acetyltransferase [Shewanella gelidii]GGI72146.1 ribosomal-protein-alanine acetyltransferase [Shewanella gelidii]
MTRPIDFEPLHLTHAAVMHQIETEATAFPLSLTAIQSCFGALYQVTGAYRNNELLGFTIVHQVFEEATLMDICVSKNAQGSGIGKRLLQDAIEHLQNKQCEVLMLEVRASNQQAINLYRGLGFEQIGVRQNYYRTHEGKEDAVLMNLEIKKIAP